MRITPAARHGSAVWAHDQARMITLGVWTEKKPGRGEDAEPLVLFHDGSRLGLLAVCDGVGGAGVQVAGHTSGGTERSGAWVSSRAVRLALEQYFVRQVRFAGRRSWPQAQDHAAQHGPPARRAPLTAPQHRRRAAASCATRPGAASAAPCSGNCPAPWPRSSTSVEPGGHPRPDQVGG